MMKLSSAVIAVAALVLAGGGSVAHAAQPGVAAGSVPRVAAQAMTRNAPAATRAAPAMPRGPAPTVAPGFAPQPLQRHFNPAIVRPLPPMPGVSAVHIHVPTARHLIPKAPPSAAFNHHAPRDHRGRRIAGRYPYGYPYGYPYAQPYFYGYGAGLGVPFATGRYLVDNGAYGVCFRLLQKYRETGAAKWRKRYDKCLAGDYSQIDYL